MTITIWPVVGLKQFAHRIFKDFAMKILTELFCGTRTITVSESVSENRARAVENSGGVKSECA
jgi:hypothetical protein